MKIVIFNVSSALSAYVEFGKRKVVIDLGKCSDCSPVNDFLLPLFRKRERDNNPLEPKPKQECYTIDQLIISHPHKDHLSDIQDFDKYFNPLLLTTPNAKDTDSELNINWSHITTPDDEDVLYLKKMMINRNPPLTVTDSSKMTLAYLYPKAVEDNTTLDTESYTNNVSLAVYINDRYSILFPGDLQKEGMKALLNGTTKNKLGKTLKNQLQTFGVDFLVAPHHGLRSSFSTALFDAIKGHKTHKLNIVPEKSSTEDDTRQVDSRYASTDYCEAANNLSTKDSPACQRKTSNGHIYIDDDGNVHIESDIKEILKYFN